MSSQTSRPRFQVTKPSSLKKTTPRPVGSEATKPKPKKVELPTYEEQNDEQGSQDESSEGEEVEEEMTVQPQQTRSNLKPTKAKSATVSAQQGPPRVKKSARADQKTVPRDPLVDGASIAPHMKMLALTSGNKSALTKPNGFSFYVPFLFILGYINQAVASLLVNKKQVSESHPLYNSIFSRTAIFVLAHMHILRAREFANVITDDELKVLKRFRASFDFNKIVVPGPYVLFLQSIGVHVPANKRFLSVIPSFPSVDSLIHAQGNGNGVSPAMNAWTTALGFIPWLIAMSSVIATKQNIGEEYKHKKLDDTDDAAAKPVNFEGRYFVPFHRDLKSKGQWTGVERGSAQAATSNTGYFAQSASFHCPFPDSLNHLKNVYDAVPPVSFPSYVAGKKMNRLMEYFYLDKDVSFYSVLFEALAIEARFFEGMTTFENIDVETGAQVTCSRTVALEGSALPDNLEWFQPIPVEEDGITVYSRVADITDTDLQLALFSGVVTSMSVSGTAAHTVPIASFDSTKAKLDATDTTSAPIYTHEDKKRQISRQNPFVDEIRTHIYTSMMYDISEVL